MSINTCCPGRLLCLTRSSELRCQALHTDKALTMRFMCSSKTWAAHSSYASAWHKWLQQLEANVSVAGWNFALTHLENSNTYVRMLFSSTHIVQTLNNSCRSSSVFTWILDFLQNVRMGKYIFSTLILNTGTPQGCVLRLLFYCLYSWLLS